MLRRFVDYELLILDEVGIQFGTETERLILFQLLNERYTQVKPTILISNLPVELSDKERFEVRRPDNPKAVQFFMTMYFGCDFQSIDPRAVNFGSFTIGEDTADVSTEPEETLQEDDPETV